jgi:hypothetical protein
VEDGGPERKAVIEDLLVTFGDPAEPDPTPEYLDTSDAD